MIYEDGVRGQDFLRSFCRVPEASVGPARRRSHHSYARPARRRSHHSLSHPYPMGQPFSVPPLSSGTAVSAVGASSGGTAVPAVLDRRLARPSTRWDRRLAGPSTRWDRRLAGLIREETLSERGFGRWC